MDSAGADSHGGSGQSDVTPSYLMGRRTEDDLLQMRRRDGYPVHLLASLS